MERTSKAVYSRPELIKFDNLKNITQECAGWQCSVTVPPAPQQP